MIDKIFSIFCFVMFFSIVILNLVLSIITKNYSKLFCIGYFIIIGIISGVAEFFNAKHISTKVGLSEWFWTFVASAFIGLVISCFI